MRQAIINFENQYKKADSLFSKLYYGSLLIFVYTIFSIINLWHILFSPPQKSFVMLYAQDEQGVWKKSYFDHLKYRHNVRFGGLSFTLLLVTSICAVQMILGLFTPFNKVEITYAATLEVTNANDSGAGSLRQALSDAGANPGADIINITASGTVNVGSMMAIPDDVTIDATGVDYILDASGMGGIGAVLNIDSDNVSINNITIQNGPANGILLNGVCNNITLENVIIDNNQGMGIGGTFGGSDLTFTNTTISNNGSSGTYSGLNLENFNEITIEGGEYSNNTGSGIGLRGSSNVDINNTDIFQNTYAGISIDTTNIALVDGCNVYSNSIGVAVYDDVNDLTISNSDLYSNSGEGIKIDAIGGTSDNCDIINNNIYNNDIGINIAGNTLTNAIISGSTIHSNTSNGIEAKAVSGISISNNYIGTNVSFDDLGNGISGIVLRSSTTASTIESNYIYYNAGQGIKIKTSANHNTIGAGNVIMFSDLGVAVDGASTIHNKITQNNIQSISLIDGGNESLAKPEIEAVASSKKLWAKGTAVENIGTIELGVSDTANAFETYLESFSTTDGTFEFNVAGDYVASSFSAATFTDSDNNTSEIASEAMIIDNIAPAITIEPAGGEFANTQEITLSATDENDSSPKIYYTLDGSNPTTSSTEYSEPISISQDKTLKCIAVDYVDNISDIQTESYEFNNTNNNSNANTNSSSWLMPDFDKRTADTTPSFKFNAPASKIGRKIIVKILQKKQTILTLSKKINKKGRAVVTVPYGSELTQGKYNGESYLKNEETIKKKFNFQIIDFPPDLEEVSKIITPDDILPIASTGEKITGIISDSNGERVSATSSNPQFGVHELKFNILPSAGYPYTLAATAYSNGTKSEPSTKQIWVSTNKYVDTFVLKFGEPNWLTYSNDPKIAGLTPETKIPDLFLDGKNLGKVKIQEPCSKTCSWVFQLSNVSVGEHTIKVAGKEWPFRRDNKTVAPAVVSLEDGANVNSAPVLTIIGAANNKLVIEGIKEAYFDNNGAYKLNTALFAKYGLNTLRMYAVSSGKRSDYTVFAFNLRRQPAKYPSINTDDNTNNDVNNVNNTNTNIDTANNNVNVNKNLNVNANINVNASLEKPILMAFNDEKFSSKEMLSGSLKFNSTKEYGLLDLTKRVISLGKYSTEKNSIIFSGQIPKEQLNGRPAHVYITIYSDPVIKMAQADENGQWTIIVPLELLPPGEHTAYAQTEIGGEKSQQIELAKFAIEEKVKISKTTWLVIINVAIAVILLVTAIIIQMVRNKKKGGLANES